MTYLDFSFSECKPYYEQYTLGVDLSLEIEYDNTKLTDEDDILGFCKRAKCSWYENMECLDVEILKGTSK